MYTNKDLRSSTFDFFMGTPAAVSEDISSGSVNKYLKGRGTSMYEEEQAKVPQCLNIIVTYFWIAIIICFQSVAWKKYGARNNWHTLTL